MTVNILAKAKEHFAGLKGSKVEAPEWGVTVHFDPPSLAQRSEWNGKGESYAQARVLIDCAKDQDGNPLFEDNAEVLASIQNDVDPKVIGRVVRAILGTEDENDMGNAS